MSLLTRLKNVFTKPESKNLLGVCLRQQAVAFSYRPEQGECQHVELPSSLTKYVLTLKNMNDKNKLVSQCHLVLAPSQTQVVQVDKPDMPEEEINAALKWLVKDLVSYKPEDMIVDYFDSLNMSAIQAKINVVCASKKDLAQLIAPLSEHGLSLKSVITEEFAFASLMPKQDDACLMVCQQPNEEIVLLIVKQGQLCFTRRLRGFAQIATKTEDELNAGIVDSLSLEIQRSTDYYERQLKQAPITSIEVLVPMTNEALLARKLAENTNIQVNLLTLPDGYQTAREFAVPIGAIQFQLAEASS